MTECDPTRWYHRWRGLVGLAVARVRRQMTTVAQGQTVATVLIVAVTVANLVLVTGVALALANDQGLAHDADVRAVPGDSDVQSSVAGVEAPRLGASHERAREIRERAGVTHATPVLAEPVRVRAPDSAQAHYILVVGIIPGPASATVAGLPTDTLAPGDPHYAGGTYDGPPAEEIVLSTAAAETLDVSPGESLALTSDRAERTATVMAVEQRADDGTEMPVALVHLSDLQSLTAADNADLADQVLVWGEQEAAQAGVDAAYPTATVETTSAAAIVPSALFDDTLALVTSVLALVIAVSICTLFVATTSGLTVEANRQTLATLSTIGFPLRSQLAIVAVTTVAMTGCGAVLGLALGAGAITAVNAFATATIAPSAVAAFHPLVVPYALAVALLAALLALPYPLALAARTEVLAEVNR